MRIRNRSHFSRFVLFNDDNDDPPGGGGGNGSGDRDSALTALRAKFNNDLERAVATLFDENYRLRAKNRKLTEAAEAAKLPEGAVVLTKEQAGNWEAYQKLGAPDSLVKKEDLDAVNSKLEALDARARHDTAAKELGWKGAVLHDLAESKGLHVEVKDETENGKAVKRVYTRPKADDKAPLVLLEKHVNDNLADYLPSLKVAQGTSLPPQFSASGGGSNQNGGGSIVDDYLAKRNDVSKARTNPLVKPTAAPSAAAK